MVLLQMRVMALRVWYVKLRRYFPVLELLRLWRVPGVTTISKDESRGTSSLIRSILKRSVSIYWFVKPQENGRWL